MLLGLQSAEFLSEFKIEMGMLSDVNSHRIFHEGINDGWAIKRRKGNPHFSRLH